MSTVADTFHPWFWLRNPHAQTILAMYWKGSAFPFVSVRRRLQLDDGDQLVLHDTTPSDWKLGNPIAVLLHGLGGCHRSGAIVRMARILCRQGVRAVRLDLRGTGAGFRLARGCYNAGCSDDVRAVLRAFHRLAPSSPLWLIGISLGGNVALKLAGEPTAQPVSTLSQVAVMAPPVDLEACMTLLTQPRNRIYERHFVRALIGEARRRARLFPDPPLPNFPKPTTLRMFDELYTAPRAGFRNAADYYARSSANQFVSRIRVPTLILAARDDPFVDPRPIEALRRFNNVEICLTDHGGHTGFLGKDGAGGVCWGEHAMVNWLLRAGSQSCPA